LHIRYFFREILLVFAAFLQRALKIIANIGFWLT